MSDVKTAKNGLACDSSHMSVEKMMHDMIEMLTDAMGDAVKHDKGNKAAGTRVRKAMQEAKATAQAIRVQVQNDKN
tara:strand:- start:14 stop:241 length:228 start_codon:yes stop_codon:yes gene_type:complete